MPESGAVLRPARPDDETAILALTSRLADFTLPPGRTAHEIAVADHPMLRAQLADPHDDVLFLVAHDETGALLGSVFANTRRDYVTTAAHAYVEVLAVADAAAGRGVARTLMDAEESWAGARRLARVDLSVFSANRRARGFYEHLGYQEELVRYVKPIP